MKPPAGKVKMSPYPPPHLARQKSDPILNMDIDFDDSSVLTAPRPDKKGRSVSGNSPTEPGKGVKADHPVPGPSTGDIDMRDAKPPRNRLTRFDHLWCAVSIDSNEIIGGPFSATPGWDVKLSLNPGVLGQPSVVLDFKFAKEGDESKGADHYNSFAVGWEPGVLIGHKWMMEGLHVERSAHPSHPGMLAAFPQSLRKLCKKDGDDERLYCMAFRSHSHKTSPMEVDWTKSLPGDDWVAPFTNLQRMYGEDQDPSYNLYVWFMCPNHQVDYFYASCLKPLVDAVNDHTRPFHQCLDIGEEVREEAEEEAEEEIKVTDAEPTDDLDALRAENLKLKTEKKSLQILVLDQTMKVGKLADDLRRAHKERDEIVQVAAKMKHQRELKPKQIRKALNDISKIVG